MDRRVRRCRRKEGAERATFILRKLLDHARARRVPLPPVLNTPYCNTISLAEQPQYPGNLEIEQRLSALVRWNALAMVVRANREHPELGGHIASYASAADLFEVGFNHFFRAGPERRPGLLPAALGAGRLCARVTSKAGSPKSISTTTGARPAARACPRTAIRS